MTPPNSGSPSQPLTVLFVVGAGERAGAERVLLTLARAVDRSRVRPVVAFLDRGPFVDEVRTAGIEVVELGPSGRLRDLRQAPRAVARLRDAIESVGADVVQATGDKMSVYAGWAARLARRPCVFWLHNAPGTPTWFAQIGMALTPRGSVVACSRWMAEAFRARLRLPAIAIQNGLPLDELPVPPGSRDEILEAAGWPEDTIVVGHFARLQRWKGTEVFIRAGAEIAERHPRLRFLVVGGALFGREQEYADNLPRLAADLGLADRIHFTGFRPDALDLMAGSDVVAHCSLRADPFPTVVLEAMALGRPVVATRTRGPEESLEHGRTGLLVAPGDHVELAEALDRFAGSSEMRAAVGRAAREDALENYSAERFAAEFEDHWSRLVDRRARPRMKPTSPTRLDDRASDAR